MPAHGGGVSASPEAALTTTARSLRFRHWAVSAIVLVAVWAVVLTAVNLSRNFRVTPESIKAQASAQPLAELDGPAREKAIADFAKHLQQLPLDERLDPQVQSAMLEQFSQMTPDEQREFVKSALPKGIEQVAEAFNTMPPAMRQQMIQRVVESWQAAPQAPEGLDAEAIEQMIQEGIVTLFQKTDAEAKLDLLPLMQRLQQAMQKR